MFKRKVQFRQVRDHIYIVCGDNTTLLDIVLYGYMSGNPLYELHRIFKCDIIGVDDV